MIIDSDLDELFAVSILIRGTCDHFGIDAHQAASLELCAVEAVTNAIKHAYGGALGHDVSLAVSFEGKRVDMEVSDSGLRMPEEQLKNLACGSDVLEFDPADLDTLPEGGMGLEIIRREMDEASYSTDGGNNCLKLTRFLRSSESRLSHD
jgi:serine/threonine-protein kinase RsbW